MSARLSAVLAAALALGSCATAPVAEPVVYTGTPQDQWIQGQRAYEAWSAKRRGWRVSDSGLQHQRLNATRGARPAADAVVTIHYVGRFIDGRVFDSSRDRGEPATFPLPRLIKGWQEGVPMMRVGETWRFVIPSHLAYGDRDRAPIPPGSTLLFEIELIAIPEETAP